MKRRADHRKGYRVTFRDGGPAWYAFANSITHAKDLARLRMPHRDPVAAQRS